MIAKYLDSSPPYVIIYYKLERGIMSLTFYAFCGAALVALGAIWTATPIRWPRIRFRSATERHNGIRITDVGVTLQLPRWRKRRPDAASQMLECAFYLTYRK
jgi:hypothetical protein